MTNTTQTIFEKHEIRKTKEQKEEFRAYLLSLADEYGYRASVEDGARSSKNVIVGDPEHADVIYGAHYDTCAVMPMPNLVTPKNFLVYLIYQLVLTTIMFIIPILIMFVASPIILDKTGSQTWYTVSLVGGYALLWAILFLATNGPANKHTANDNTSGITLLIDIMRDLPQEMRGKVAFIFFDLEEKGLVGSASYKKLHKNIAESKPLINFDCVSDGKDIMFVLRKKAVCLEEKLREAFPSNDSYTVHVESKGVFYPSDQRNFDVGVGVSALNRTKHGLLYMDKIHTPKDTVYDEENIEFLKEGAIRLAGIIAEEKTETVNR